MNSTSSEQRTSESTVATNQTVQAIVARDYSTDTELPPACVITMQSQPENKWTFMKTLCVLVWIGVVLQMFFIFKNFANIINALNHQ